MKNLLNLVIPRLVDQTQYAMNEMVSDLAHVYLNISAILILDVNLNVFPTMIARVTRPA